MCLCGDRQARQLPAAPWHNHHCKHYANPLCIADVAGEFGKLLYDASQGNFRLPGGSLLCRPARTEHSLGQGPPTRHAEAGASQPVKHRMPHKNRRDTTDGTCDRPGDNRFQPELEHEFDDLAGIAFTSYPGSAHRVVVENSFCDKAHDEVIKTLRAPGAPGWKARSRRGGLLGSRASRLEDVAERTAIERSTTALRKSVNTRRRGRTQARMRSGHRPAIRASASNEQEGPTMAAGLCCCPGVLPQQRPNERKERAVHRRIFTATTVHPAPLEKEPS